MFYQKIEKFVGETFTKKGKTSKIVKSKTQMAKLLKKGNCLGPKLRRLSGKRKSVLSKKNRIIETDKFHVGGRER